MHFSWLGFMEMFVVLAFAIGWGIVELVALRLDKPRGKDGKPAASSGDAPTRRD